MIINAPSSVIFVDSNIADYQSLVNSVEPGTKVVVLDTNRNGVEQITEVLANYDNLDSVQILSHGDSGVLQLGSSTLNNGNIESYENQLQQWGKALSENGDILLYGCNVAEGEQGQAFINRLGEITAADIAASEDLTGSSDLGGDWVLEATTGFIESPLAFQVEAMSAFNSVLQTFTVTNANNSGAGSLRQAILDSENNNNGGTRDIIQVDEGLTINLTDSLPTISEDVEIRGNGVVINGLDRHQILAINGETDTTQIILSDISLRDGNVRGSNGAAGGGGGLGAGGALFINNGTVIANNVQFTDNSAVGGDSANGARGGSAERTGENGGRGGIANENGTAFADQTAANGGTAGRGERRNGRSGGSGSSGSNGTFGNGGGAGGGGGGGESGGLQEGRGGFGGDGGDGGFGAGGGAGGGAGSNPNRRRRRRTALGGDGGNGGVFGGDGGDGVDVPPNGSRGPAVRGGGGAGLGGAIFVQNEAELILLNSNFSGNSTTGGTGANRGQAKGSDIFVMDNASVSRANTNVTTGNNLDNGRVFGDISNFILPTINLAPGDNLSEPDQNGSFNLSLNRSLPIDLIVNYTITGTAINDPDLFDDEEIDSADVSIPLSVTIPTGDTTGSINAEVIDDRLFDPNENIIITLEDSPLYNLGDAISAELSIVDDEPDISLDGTNAVEGESNGQFIFNLDPNAPEGRQLSFRITGGTAELDTDYRLLNADDEPIVGDEDGNFFLDISGEERVVVQVDATGISGGVPDFDDSTAEENETVEITLNPSEEYGGGGNTITANIVDNDSPPTIDVVAGDNAIEENSEPGIFELDLSNSLLSNGNENDDEDAIFNFTIGGDATRGEDYNLVLVANDTDRDIIDNSFSLPEGTDTASIEVRPIDENEEEVNENVTFTLNEGEGYELGETSAELTIEDSGRDDADNVVGVQIIESQGSTNLIEGQTTDNYTLELTSEPTSDVTISFATDTTQVESIDPITFTPENFNSRQNVTVVSVDDNITTEDRTSVISHTATSDDAAYQGITINEVTVNITENDVPGIVIANGNNFSITEGAAGEIYTIALATEPTADVKTNIDISDDIEAIAPITFTPDNFATPQEVTVTAAIDDEVEETEFQNIAHIIESDDPVYDGLSVQPLPIAINELSFDNIETAGGLNNALNSIQDSLDAQFRAIELPFVGSLETLAPDLIGSFQNTLINRVQTGGVLDVEKLGGLVEETIEEILEVDVEASATLSEEEATFDITVAKEFNLANIDLDADLDLPGLGIDVDGSVDLTFDYQFDLGFGISQEFGFFIDTEKTNFTAGVELGLSDDFQATGNLGFLQLDLVNDEENPTAVSADFSLGLNDIDNGENSDTDENLDAGENVDNDENSNTGEDSEEEDLDGDRLTSTELRNASFDDISDLFNPSASASANLGLKAVTSVEADTAFPSINFDLAGEFGSFTFEEGEAVGDFSPTIAFNNVQLDLGSFLSDFARPVIGNINSIIDPFRPVVDFLNTDTEILNDLSIADGLDGNGDGEISVIELAIGIAELAGNPPNARFQEAFDQITELFALSDALNESIAGDEGILIDVGSFELGNFDPSDPDADPSEVEADQTDSAPDLDQQLDDAPDDGSRNTQKANTNRILNNGNFDIPLIDNPFSAIDLLLGKDVALFTYDLPALEVGFDVQQTFPIFGPISGLLEGDFNVALDLAFGFDTFGFNQWSANNFDPLESFRVLDGFFVSDRENPDGTGEDIDELVATATIAAGLGVDLIALSGFLKGGLEGIIGLDLIDGGEINGTDDGRLRASEIADRISTPFELFQLNGIVNAFLGAEVQLFRRTVFEQRIATFPLAEFSVGGKGNSFSSVIDGVISGGTVFFDANFNGIQDPNEPVTISNADGSYDLDIPFSPFDLNSNGVIDPEEGRVVIVNGIDISTSLPQTAPIITTPNATIATPLTSLAAEIAEPDLEAAQAEVINIFGLSENSDLYNDDPQTSQVSVLGLQSQLQNLIILATKTIAATSLTGQTINGSEILSKDGLIYLDNNNNQQFDDGDLELVQADDGSRFFDVNDNGELDNNEVSSTVNEAQIASAILEEIAVRINNGEAPDLADTDTVTAIINEALTFAIAEDSNINLNENAISELTASIVEKNLNIDGILDKAFLSEAEQRQQISGRYVFIDVNDNGIQDTDEPSSLVDETGGDELDITPFDTNENGLLDVRVVVEGESPDFVFVDSNANGEFDPDEPFSVVNPSGDNNLEIDFIDNNGNGVQDENEPFSIAYPLNPDGTEVVISPFDLNENGVLEVGEDDNNNGILDPGEDNNENGVLELDELGQVVLESPPVDRWSFVDSNSNGEFDRGELFSPVFDDGTDLLDPFVEPGKVFVDATESPELAGGFQHLVTNPLATISRLLAEATDTAVAQDLVKTAFGLPEDVDLLNFDALQAASNQDPNWLEVYAAQVQVQNTLVQIEAVTGVSETEIVEALSNEIANSENLDLSDSTQLEGIINELAPELADNTVDGAAEIITESNERIDDIADDGTIGDREKSIEIVQVQQVAQSDDPEGLVEDLLELGTEEENVEEIVDDNTGEQLTEQIENTEEIDPTTRPDFSNSRPIAEPDVANTDLATSVTINVLDNDSDPDNDAIEIVDIFASDNAEVVINPDNTLTYTPNNGFAGEDIIFYAIQDSNGSVDNNIVTVTVRPDGILREGNDDNDFINGSEGNDTYIGRGGNDLIRSHGGDDSLSGGPGEDTLEGGADDDNMNGGSGSDRMFGVSGDDLLIGRPGNDILLGGEGDDTLEGGIGRDRLNGGPGNDQLSGGGSIDRFIFNTNQEFKTEDVGIDTITDFSKTQRDIILLDLRTFTAINSDPGTGFSIATEFVTVTDDESAENSNAVIVYNSENGNLFYNPNGSEAGFSDGGQFATLTNTPELEAGDFFLRG